jgi:hypothetical protein
MAAKSRTITIKKDDIFFDIDSLSLSFSEVSGGDGIARADAIAAETGTTAGTRKYTRLADRRAADIRTLLRRFLTTTSASTANDQLSTSDYAFALTLDSEFEDAMMAPLTAEIHDYIMKGALADWYDEIGLKAQHDTLDAEAETAKARIKELIFYRPAPSFRS